MVDVLMINGSRDAGVMARACKEGVGGRLVLKLAIRELAPSHQPSSARLDRYLAG